MPVLGRGKGFDLGIPEQSLTRFVRFLSRRLFGSVCKFDEPVTRQKKIVQGDLDNAKRREWPQRNLWTTIHYSLPAQLCKKHLDKGGSGQRNFATRIML